MSNGSSRRKGTIGFLGIKLNLSKLWVNQIKNNVTQNFNSMYKENVDFDAGGHINQKKDLKDKVKRKKRKC